MGPEPQPQHSGSHETQRPWKARTRMNILPPFAVTSGIKARSSLENIWLHCALHMWRRAMCMGIA